MGIFWEIHKDLPREGPGDDASTLRAFRATGLSVAKVLDIGCGPGMQTIALANNFECEITAIDTHQPFLDALAMRASNIGISNKIRPVNMSMFKISFEDGAFDIVWSEGAIYIIGFEKGLRAWRKYVKSGGFVAVSEVAWLTEEPPNEVREFWEREYPAIKSIEANLEIAKRAGYDVVENFTLPVSAWENYYVPMKARLAELSKKHAGDEEVMIEIRSHEREIEIFEKYKEHYGYVFYVLRKK